MTPREIWTSPAVHPLDEPGHLPGRQDPRLVRRAPGIVDVLHRAIGDQAPSAGTAEGGREDRVRLQQRGGAEAALEQRGVDPVDVHGRHRAELRMPEGRAEVGSNRAGVGDDGLRSQARIHHGRPPLLEILADGHRDRLDVEAESDLGQDVLQGLLGLVRGERAESSVIPVGPAEAPGPAVALARGVKAELEDDLVSAFRGAPAPYVPRDHSRPPPGAG